MGLIGIRSTTAVWFLIYFHQPTTKPHMQINKCPSQNTLLLLLLLLENNLTATLLISQHLNQFWAFLDAEHQSLAFWAENSMSVQQKNQKKQPKIREIWRSEWHNQNSDWYHQIYARAIFKPVQNAKMLTCHWRRRRKERTSSAPYSSCNDWSPRLWKTLDENSFNIRRKCTLKLINGRSSPVDWGDVVLSKIVS